MCVLHITRSWAGSPIAVNFFDLPVVDLNGTSLVLEIFHHWALIILFDDRSNVLSPYCAECSALADAEAICVG